MQMDARWLLGGGFDPVHFHAARRFRIRLTSHASLSKNPFPKQPTTTSQCRHSATSKHRFPPSPP